MATVRAMEEAGLHAALRRYGVRDYRDRADLLLIRAVPRWLHDSSRDRMFEQQDGFRKEALTRRSLAEFDALRQDALWQLVFERKEAHWLRCIPAPTKVVISSLTEAVLS